MTCDKVYDITPHYDCGFCNQYETNCKYETAHTCLTFKELDNYLQGKLGFGWHISNLKIYDQAKELKEFNMKRPPQSWCYVNTFSYPKK